MKKCFKEDFLTKHFFGGLHLKLMVNGQNNIMKSLNFKEIVFKRNILNKN